MVNKEIWEEWSSSISCSSCVKQLYRHRHCMIAPSTFSLASFFLKPKRSSIENNFLYLLVSILSSAPSENMRTINLIFAIDWLFHAYFFPQRPYHLFTIFTQNGKKSIGASYNQYTVNIEYHKLMMMMMIIHDSTLLDERI